MEKFSSENGMKVKLWGSKFWDSLFTMVLGSYPYTINPKNKDHIKTMNSFISFFNNLRWTLPCIYCRKSYCKFYRKIPIQDYSNGRIQMMKWLYLIKDQVNKKLLAQEEIERNEMKKMFNSGKITKKDYQLFLKNQFKTKQSPKFIKVLEKYEKLRASCKK